MCRWLDEKSTRLTGMRLRAGQQSDCVLVILDSKPNKLICLSSEARPKCQLTPSGNNNNNSTVRTRMKWFANRVEFCARRSMSSMAIQRTTATWCRVADSFNHCLISIARSLTLFDPNTARPVTSNNSIPCKDKRVTAIAKFFGTKRQAELNTITAFVFNAKWRSSVAAVVENHSSVTASCREKNQEYQQFFNKT